MIALALRWSSGLIHNGKKYVAEADHNEEQCCPWSLTFVSCSHVSQLEGVSSVNHKEDPFFCPSALQCCSCDWKLGSNSSICYFSFEVVTAFTSVLIGPCSTSVWETFDCCWTFSTRGTVTVTEAWCCWLAVDVGSMVWLATDGDNSTRQPLLDW